MGNSTSFKPGYDPRRASGRRTGAKVKLTAHFLEALQEDFQENGVSAIKEARVQNPLGYLQIVRSLLPKEIVMDVTNRTAEELSDDELAAIIASDSGEGTSEAAAGAELVN